jgi:Ca2+-dependent lipid-binding protein
LERTKSKGTIHYAVSFHPTLELAKQEEKEDEGEKTPAAGEENKESVDQTEAAIKDTAVGGTSKESKSDDVLPEKDIHGETIQYTDDKKINLIGYESGILTVTIQSVKIPTRNRTVVDVMVDSNDAQFTTSQLRGVELPFHETGDAFVKEMDFSRLMVNVRRWTDNDKEREVIGYYTTPVRDIVRQIMNDEHDSEKSKEVTLLDCAGGTARLAFKFTPVIQFKLDPAESLESKCGKQKQMVY